MPSVIDPGPGAVRAVRIEPARTDRRPPYVPGTARYTTSAPVRAPRPILIPCLIGFVILAVLFVLMAWLASVTA